LAQHLAIEFYPFLKPFQILYLLLFKPFIDAFVTFEIYEKIAEKKSVHLAAIKQMAKDRPEPTAMLIKTWLAEV
jgi:hypothetical protein